eukprot:CAMPEP_0113844904 /NCGR_PEP_ID=MMETSP0372-20130328/477_1 /TAXON_ID=340204 /ORGANISM="Lankesteria abbotti" /LENGTH=316 /DNA_ID=CAMNT_0000813921 /DNA_START=185 /DNA_END=1135 /DNA_ORIENTATION=+ /assembly_acc=CAM_ASM_000359
MVDVVASSDHSEAFGTLRATIPLQTKATVTDAADSLLSTCAAPQRACCCCCNCECSPSEPVTTELLMAACDTGGLHYVRHAACMLGPDIMSMADEDGMTALHVASQKGHLPVLKFLLNVVESSPQTNSARLTPRHTHKKVTDASFGSATTVASTGSDDRIGNGTASEDAKLSAASSTTGSSLSHHTNQPQNDDEVNVHEGAPTANINSSSLWADKTTNRGHTALHWAAIKGHYHCVVELLSFGFAVDALSMQEATPLHLAVAAVKPDIVRLLVKHGADINATTLSGSYPHKVTHYLGDLTLMDALKGEENSPLSFF